MVKIREDERDGLVEHVLKQKVEKEEKEYAQ